MTLQQIKLFLTVCSVCRHGLLGGAHSLRDLEDNFLLLVMYLVPLLSSVQALDWSADAFGKTRGTVARVHIGQVTMSVFTKL